MNIKEKKSQLLKRISDLDDEQFKKIYDAMDTVLQSNKVYELNEEENRAIDEALDLEERERRLAHKQVVNEAREKYPDLKFK